ncbi:Spc97 / Spc98 family of spindle pole body (SBP) component [Citrus sinensis]|uniref:Spc97 / Spc98 family of spindle pole body (SBP) component n=1 Tax=Citrus sinensis TaxID=2711 RepID=A0ACB8IQD2_CITSI|nr:Spc97 / Spc98 family of spindle pole body (SBP) component [Citrus sinensis]
MAGDANFASSLLEKVKVEDPWLPPRTWESIPSQSGPHLSSSSSSNDHRHLHCATSSLSEASVVRLALNALQGLESALISIEKLAVAFCCDPADRTFHRIPNLWNRSSSTHSLGKILKSIGCSGILVFLMRKFVDHFRNLDACLTRQSLEDKEQPPYSLVNQAFAVAVNKVLEGYVCALDTLYASVGLRRSSKGFDAVSEEGCLTSGVQSKITLLEVYLHTRELRTQIEVLGNICNLHDIAICFSESSTENATAKAISEFKSFWRGGDLLTYLYTQLQVADSAHRPLLKFLFLRSCEPYCRFIRSWIFKAEINDPYREFVVEYVGNSPVDQHGKTGTSIDFPGTNIRERVGVSIPCFLKHFLIPLIRAGQQLQVVSHNEAPAFLGNGESLETSFSFELNDMMTVPSTVDQRGSNVENGSKDFDNSSMKDEFCYDRDTSESSECSSSIDSEEQNEAEQLIQPRNNLFEIEQKYFSALSFSMTTPNGSPLRKSLHNEKSGHKKRDSHEFCERDDTLSHFVLTQHKRAILSGTSVLPESGESHLSCRNGHYTDGLADKCWPLGCLLKNPFCVDGGGRNDPELHPSVSGQKLSEENIRVSKEGISFYSEKFGSNNALIEGTLGENQLENGYAVSDVSAMLKWKLNHSGNMFSINPMLTRNALFYTMGKPEGRLAADLGKSLPCFDFSSVEDPCKVFLEKVAIGFAQAASEDSSLSAISGERNPYSEPVGEILIDNPKVSCVEPHLESKDHSKNIVGTDISGTSSWESLLSTSNNIENNTVEDHRQEFSAIFEIPLDFIIDKCLLQEILLQYPFLSSDSFGFLCFKLQKWCFTEADHKVSEIQGILELSVQRSSCERDHNKNRLFVYIKEDGTSPLSTSSTGVRSFNFLGLGYRVDWPVSIVLTSNAMEIYADIFSFLIQVKLAVFSLNDVWRSLKVKDMMDLESVHMAYLSDALDICFLSDETRVVASIIEGILQCALDFQSCLTRGIWDAELDQGDFLGKLSRINVSQVLAIKQKFDKNLKELHLCYLKSPKHGEFGLSRFWRYLNYNEFFSDINNGMARYPFGV